MRYLTLDYGGSSIKYSIMDKDLHVYESGIHPVKRTSLEEMLESARELNEKFKGQFDGVAVSAPGRIDTEKGFAHTGGAFSFVRNIPLAQIYEEIYQKPVVIGNDAKCAAAAELYEGALKGCDSGAVIVLGTGVGGGIIVNGRVWMGKTGGAGELSLLLQNADECLKMFYPEDPDGNGGRFHPNQKAMYMGNASTTGLLTLYAEAKGTTYDPKTMNGMQFFADYDAGDAVAHQVLDRFAKYVAAGIFTIQSVLDAERYAIGGGISARAEITDKVREVIDHIFGERFSVFGKPEIVACKFRNEANQVGALMFYLQKHPE